MPKRKHQIKPGGSLLALRHLARARNPVRSHAAYSAVRNPGNPIHATSHLSSGAGVSDVRSPLLDVPTSGFYSSGPHNPIAGTGMWPSYNIGPPAAHQRI